MPRTSGATRLALISLSLLLGQLAPLAACDVPVYEYALLHWPRQDYTVYYLHDGTEATADAEVNGLLRNVAAGKEGQANLRFTALDASLGLADLTPEARDVLGNNAEATRPRHLVVSPKGRTIFSGRLTVADVRDLLTSPKTTALADMLSRGAPGVVLVLTDSDEAQNRAALETVQSALNAAKDAKARSGLLEVLRQDPQERWLVRQLLTVEADLEAIRGPMVFGAFGRCHVTEPYLGKGINRANLTALAEFMNGPCTCEIKAANMGLDLISDRDWEAQVSGGAKPRPLEPPGYVTFDE